MSYRDSFFRKISLISGRMRLKKNEMGGLFVRALDLILTYLIQEDMMASSIYKIKFKSGM